MVSYYLRDKKAKKRTSIGAYIFINSKRLHFTTGLQIPPDKWDPENQKAITGRGFTAGVSINIRLKEISEAIENAYYKGKAENRYMDRNYFQKVIHRPTPVVFDFYKEADNILDHLNRNEQYRYEQSINAQLNKFKEFAKEKYPDYTTSLPLDCITVKMLKDFKSYLQSIGNNPNTVKASFKKLKYIYDEGVKNIENQEIRTQLTVNSPFKRIGKLKPQESEKVKLTDEQVQKLIECKLTPGSLQWHCRNAWLFSYYTAGIRAGDVLLLKKENFDFENNRYYYLIGNTERTNAVKHSMILIPQARAIVDLYAPGKADDDFLFPFIKEEPKNEFDKLKKINRGSALWRKFLTQVSAKAGIPRISPHIARHSFADRGRRAQADPYGIKMALRHSSLEVTQEYLKDFDTESIDRAVLKTFGYDGL